jgi:hypothetical protein
MTSWRQYFLHIERTYGLTEVDYRALYRAQGGRCYICRRAAGENRRLAVDHDHLTGEVRGLVCSGSLSANTCNRLIARYSRDQLLRAVAMLSDPPPARVVLAAVQADRYIPSLVGGDAFLREDLVGDVHA